MARDYDFWVYIVTNKNESVLYIGLTNALSRRITEHRSRAIPGFTSKYQCDRLIYYEHYRDVRQAIDRETQLKKWSRAKKLALIARMNPRWRDLAPDVLDEQ